MSTARQAGGTFAWASGRSRSVDQGLLALAILLMGGCAASVWWLEGDKPWLAGIVGALATASFAARGRRSRHKLIDILGDGLALTLLAATAGPGRLPWLAPTSWGDLLRFTTAGAVLACLLYMAAAWAGLGRAGRHQPRLVRLVAFTAPFLFSGLFLLGSGPLTLELTRLAAPGVELTPAVAYGAGRALILILFDVGAIVGLGLVVDGRPSVEPRLWALLLLAAVLAAFSPQIAALGSTATVAAMPLPLRLTLTVLASAAAQAGLWAQVFLLTGAALDAMRGWSPTGFSAAGHLRDGMGRGAVYAGLFILLIQLAALIAGSPVSQSILAAAPAFSGGAVGAALFPLARTVVESFDGSPPFFRRLAANAHDRWGYARGAVVGAGLGLALSMGLPAVGSGQRFLAGAALGLLAYAGVDLLRDAARIGVGPRQHFQSWRVHALGAGLGAVVGGALAWYLDTAQLEVLRTKFWAYATVSYAASGQQVSDYVIYPLVSKYGATNLGPTSGGVRLLFNESLSGVINWSLAAPLFSINLVLLTALIQRSLAPVRGLFSPAGLVGLVEQAVRVMRWGLWMAPVIYSFLRMAPDPSWYNQDGAVRTMAATVASWTLPEGEFRRWSLELFLGLLAYDWLRVLIWVDHMGLRVATLVNLSFVGGDAADEKAAAFLGHRMRSRAIPEGIRRFATWAPLLIPFYIPRGGEWDEVWGRAETLAASGAPLPLPVSQMLMAYLAAGALLATLAALLYWRSGPSSAPAPATRPMRIANGHGALELLPDGRGFSLVRSKLHRGTELDLTRRPVDPCELRGKLFYLREAGTAAWSLGAEPLGNAADQPVEALGPTSLVMRARRDGLAVEAHVDLAKGAAVEVWRLTLVNHEPRPRQVEVMSYRELAIEPVEDYRRHPAYAACHVGTRFVRALGAIIAHNRRRGGPRHGSYEVAFHAVDADGEAVRLLGYEDARQRFIGDGTLRAPMAFRGVLRRVEDEGLLFSFDPIASLTVAVDLPAGGKREILFLDGHASEEEAAVALIARHLQRPEPAAAEIERAFLRDRMHPDAMRKVADSPPFAFSEDGAELQLGVDTPRPWTHLLANPLGQGAVVSNEGEVFSFAGNAQQNALTPFTLDTVASQLPGQAIYLVDLETGDVDTPVLIPHRHADARYSVTFGRGYARFEKERNGLFQTLDLFIPREDPVELRLLRLRNDGSTSRRLRVVVYAQLVLADLASDSRGRFAAYAEQAQGLVLASNYTNDFEGGAAFVATSLDVEGVETVRARFVGKGGNLATPHFVLHGAADPAAADDGYRCAALVGTIELAPGAQVTITVAIGQAESDAAAREQARRWRDSTAVEQALEETKRWWADALSVVRVTTDWPELDRLVNDWLPYQALTARLWGRCGPSQRGGAFGYRDQLQDVIPFLFLHPELAREQILLHAAQQFPEGDVLQWWHRARGGGTGLAGRNRTSDIQLWLPYLVTRYVKATGDMGILEEPVPFLEGRAIPAGEEGIGAPPRPSREAASLYEHCRRSIRYTLARLGCRGLPLIGTGDWNDGLSAVGPKGRGESVWLGFFLHDVLVNFTGLAERVEGGKAADYYRRKARRLARSLGRSWRETRFVRAFTDAGEELAYADALTAAWPTLSGAVDFERGRMALEAALLELERPDMVLLLTPPFGPASRPNPGKIAHYPEGVRENGGQYSHGSSWLIDAAVRLAEMAEEAGDHELAAQFHRKAAELWVKISPLRKTGPATLNGYGLPPHQQPADIYAGPGREGRGGWAWYTGSAARMLSAAYALLGLHMEEGELVVVPRPDVGPAAPHLRSVKLRGREMLPATATTTEAMLEPSR